MLQAIRWLHRVKTTAFNDENDHGKLNETDRERLERGLSTMETFVSDDHVLHQQSNWNKPAGEEGSSVRPAASDPQISEQSRSTIPPSIPEPAVTSYEAPASGSKRTEIEPHASNRDLGSSRLSHPDDDSYVIPQHSSSSGAPRMIQQSAAGRTSSQNAFKRLRTMGSLVEGSEKLPNLPPPGDLGAYGYPTTKTSEKKPEKGYPGYKDYQVKRCVCGFTTFVTILLVLCAIATIVVAIIKVESGCETITIMIILMDLILLVVVIIEWIRQWLWREPVPLASKPGSKAQLLAEATMGPVNSGGGLPAINSTPGQLANPTYPALTAASNAVGGFLTFGFQQRLYDVPQFVSALCLVVLYAIGGLFIVGTMAAAGTKLGNCQTLGLFGISYASSLAILLCMRTVLCCMSDACRGLCHRTASKASAAPVPMVAVNQLHQVLPGMGGHWNSGGETTGGNSQPTAWLVNLASGTDPRHQLSMIRPMPAQYANDLTR